MEQDVQGLSSPAACSELGQSQWVVQGPLQPDLNIPKDGDATASLDNCASAQSPYNKAAFHMVSLHHV